MNGYQRPSGPSALTTWAYGYGRRAGVRELGLEHAFASRRLYTDGAEVLYDYARHAGDTPEGDSARELVVVRNNQRVFAEVVDLYLRRIDFAADGYAQLIRLPSTAPRT